MPGAVPMYAVPMLTVPPLVISKKLASSAAGSPKCNSAKPVNAPPLTFTRLRIIVMPSTVTGLPAGSVGTLPNRSVIVGSVSKLRLPISRNIPELKMSRFAAGGIIEAKRAAVEIKRTDAIDGKPVGRYRCARLNGQCSKTRVADDDLARGERAATDGVRSG